MKKYIVEAPDLKEGQKISSGGIREKGRMAVQFTNPVPYHDEELIVANQNKEDEKRMFKDQWKAYALDCCGEVIDMIWRECAKPILCAKFNQISRRAVAYINGTSPRLGKSVAKSGKRPIYIDVDSGSVRVIEK